jgi:hypothetical protein
MNNFYCYTRFKNQIDDEFDIVFQKKQIWKI